MEFILTRLVNVMWYWFIGYRLNDADGMSKLRYLIRWYSSVQIRRKAVPCRVTASPMNSSKSPTQE